MRKLRKKSMRESRALGIESYDPVSKEFITNWYQFVMNSLLTGSYDSMPSARLSRIDFFLNFLMQEKTAEDHACVPDAFDVTSASQWSGLEIGRASCRVR